MDVLYKTLIFLKNFEKERHLKLQNIFNIGMEAVLQDLPRCLRVGVFLKTSIKGGNPKTWFKGKVLLMLQIL